MLTRRGIKRGKNKFNVVRFQREGGRHKKEGKGRIERIYIAKYMLKRGEL